MSTLESDTSLEPTRVLRLRAATNEIHGRLDKAIMDGRPFESRERYGLFVTVQHGFHREIDALYHNAVLDRLLPDLKRRRRLGLITQDLGDLDVAVPRAGTPPTFVLAPDIDVPTALGWLYVAEGSNLGAAFLLKEAGKLGLSETFGARHLAPAPEGRGLHWKTFTAALNDVSLGDVEEERTIAGARAAFARVQSLTAEVLAA